MLNGLVASLLKPSGLGIDKKRRLRSRRWITDEDDHRPFSLDQLGYAGGTADAINTLTIFVSQDPSLELIDTV